MQFASIRYTYVQKEKSEKKKFLPGNFFCKALNNEGQKKI